MQSIGNNVTNGAPRVLVVSHNSALLCILWSKEEMSQWVLDVAATPWEAMEKLQSGSIPDLLLLDASHQNGEGLHLLRWMRRIRPSLPIVVTGSAADYAHRIELMSSGACEFVANPLDETELEAAIQKGVARKLVPFEAEIASEDVEPVGAGRYFIGVSPAMRKVRQQAALLAETHAPVLVLGESGSGKETVGRLIHKLSLRSGFDFVKVTCAALPGQLLMKELFGSPGSGLAGQFKPGKLELYTKGTILLHEIAELPLTLQDGLMELLRTNRVMRPGSGETHETGVRVLATISADIGSAIAENRLRQELYTQLSGYTIYVPSLRERKEEIPLLSHHFMHQLTNQYGLASREFSPAILHAWESYSWPGNVRELERAVRRYLILGDQELMFEGNRAGEMGVTRSPGPRTSGVATPSRATGAGSKSLRSLVQTVKSEAERNAIAVALEKTGWNRKAAARLLKVSYRTVLYKIQQYQMTKSDGPMMPRIDAPGRSEHQAQEERLCR